MDEDPNSICGFKMCLLEYRTSSTTGAAIGPYGIGASLLSLLIPLGIGLSIGIYYRLRSKNIFRIKSNTEMAFDLSK